MVSIPLLRRKEAVIPQEGIPARPFSSSIAQPTLEKALRKARRSPIHVSTSAIEYGLEPRVMQFLSEEPTHIADLVGLSMSENAGGKVSSGEEFIKYLGTIAFAYGNQFRGITKAPVGEAIRYKSLAEAVMYSVLRMHEQGKVEIDDAARVRLS